MKIGFLIPNYNNENRVALLPNDIKFIKNNEILIEKGFGKKLSIDDEEYKKEGCQVCTRDEIFEFSDIVFSLKLIQPSDYEKIKENQIILGWSHPTGSGKLFYETICKQKNVTLIDTDSTNPRILKQDISKRIEEIPINFCYRNSYISGIACVMHALISYGSCDGKNKKVAILSSGNVAQGSFVQLSRLGYEPKMFYRKTMKEFYDTISDYDIIVNGIEIIDGNYHIIDKTMIKKVKKGALIIDAAADAGGAIETSKFTRIDEPLYVKDGVYYYCVNNAPSILYRDVSKVISETFTKYIYNLDFDKIIKKYIGDKNK